MDKEARQWREIYKVIQFINLSNLWTFLSLVFSSVIATTRIHHQTRE